MLLGSSGGSILPTPTKTGFRGFLGKGTFFEKIVIQKNIRNLITRKKGYIRFHRHMRPSLRRGLGPPWKQFFPVFSENMFFFFAKTVGKR